MTSRVVTDFKQPVFRLLDLPPEMWSRCCRFAVVQAKPIDVIWAANPKATLAQPAITKTCRAIRAEVLPVFYGANEFRFIDNGGHYLPFVLARWTRTIWHLWPLVKKCTVKSRYRNVFMVVRNAGVAPLEIGLEGVWPVDREILDSPVILKVVAKLQGAGEVTNGHTAKGKDTGYGATPDVVDRGGDKGCENGGEGDEDDEGAQHSDG